MRSWLHAILTLAFALPSLLLALWKVVTSIDREDLLGTLFTLSSTQVHYLLLLVVSLILLFELVDEPLRTRALREELFGTSEVAPRRLLQAAWWTMSGLTVCAGIFIPLFDLLGSMPQSVHNLDQLAPKMTLILLSGVYVFQLVDRPALQRNVVSGLVQRFGTVTVYDRNDSHRHMSQLLDVIENKETVLVTQFEETQNPLHPEGYYYEQEFMTKWYRTIREKELRVRQIVLINSDSDIGDLMKRLDLVRELPTFSLAFLIAPPLTVFMDFLVIPGRVALLGMSDDRSARNMDVFDLALRKGEGVKRLERLFNDVLAPEATWVKTFEGINTAAIDKLVAEAHGIAKTPSRVLRKLFDFKDPDIA